MRKAIVIAGLIITIIGLSLIVMTSLNVANINKIVSNYTCYPTDCSRPASIDSSTLTNGQISLFHGIIANLYQPYSQVIAYVGILNPNNFPITYTVQLLAQNQAISSATVTVNAKQSSGTIMLSAFFTSGLPGIPVLMEPRYGAVPNIDFELKFSSSSSQTFTVSYLGEIVNKIIMPFLLVLTIAGLAITTIPIVLNYRKKSAARPRPLAYQSSLYEPTLAGSTQQKSQNKPFSRTTKTSSVRPTATKGPTPPKMASNVARCRSCQKPIPSKSQYCPHCYTRQ